VAAHAAASKTAIVSFRSPAQVTGAARARGASEALV